MNVLRQNPFSPTVGASPPLLVGRDPIIEDFDEAIETGPKRLAWFQEIRLVDHSRRAAQR